MNNALVGVLCIHATVRSGVVSVPKADTLAATGANARRACVADATPDTNISRLACRAALEEKSR